MNPFKLIKTETSIEGFRRLLSKILTDLDNNQLKERLSITTAVTYTTNISKYLLPTLESIKNELETGINIQLKNAPFPGSVNKNTLIAGFEALLSEFNSLIEYLQVVNKDIKKWPKDPRDREAICKVVKKRIGESLAKIKEEIKLRNLGLGTVEKLRAA